MKATDFINMALEGSKGWALGLISDMKDAPLTQPTPNGGNHPTWILGHLIHSESNLLDVFILGKENRFPEWQGVFGMKSTPTTDAGQYPSIDELLAKFEEMRAATLAHLATLSDDDLDTPSHAPEDFGPAFETVGACFAAMSNHVVFHAGQVADARKSAGRDPLFA